MEDEDPPPPPMLRSPPALPDEIVEEILVRSPPDNPAHLERAALVCKRWARLVSAGAFRRRFRNFHLQRGRRAPMLGFFIHYVGGPSTGIYLDFVRTSASCPPLGAPWRCLALDARGGRVLLYHTERHWSLVFHAGQLAYKRHDVASLGIRLAVWDPLSAAGEDLLELPVPALPRRPPSWKAVLLCCDQNGLQDDAGGSFRVVLVGFDHNGAFTCIYSSLEPAAWSEPIYTAQHPDLRGAGAGCLDAVRSSALIRNAFYFFFPGRTSILKYDLATGDISVIAMPPASHSGPMCAMLTTTEDGSLGFARLEGSKLCLWSMEPRPNGGVLAMEWTQGRIIDLTSLLPPDPVPEDPDIDLLGFADGAGMILVGTIDGFFSVDQKSGRINKLVDNPEDNPSYGGGIVPYLSFYTPALGMASADEGASVNA